jgi:hypothetical protein
VAQPQAIHASGTGLAEAVRFRILLAKTYSPLSRETPIGTLETEATVAEDSDDTTLDLGTLSITPASTAKNQSAAS